jgi:hypothetical protein
LAATVEAAGGAETRRPVVVYVLDHLVWGILAAILLVCSVTIEHFFQIGIFINIAQHATFVGLLAIGLSFCIIAGHMDLSIESVMAFAAMLAAWLTASRGSPLGIQLNTWLTLLIVLGFGALVGLVNAVLVVRFRINAFIVTLATYISVRGLGLILTGGRSMYSLPDDFRAAGSADLLGLPLLIWILVVTYLAFGAVLKKTQFGRWVFLIGGNPTAPFRAGIDVDGGGRRLRRFSARGPHQWCHAQSWRRHVVRGVCSRGDRRCVPPRRHRRTLWRVRGRTAALDHRHRDQRHGPGRLLHAGDPRRADAAGGAARQRQAVDRAEVRLEHFHAERG